MKPFYENKKDDLYCRSSEKRNKSLSYVSHLHYHIELAVLMEGKTRVTIDSEIYDVEAGDIIIIFPNQIHRLETLEKEKYFLMIVNPDMISEFSKQFISHVPTSNIIKGGALDKDVSMLTQMICDTYYSDEPYKDTILRGFLLCFFGKLLQRLTINASNDKVSSSLGTIIDYCVKNYNKPISLDIIEKELHISKYYVSHIMSTRLRMGFNEYVNSLRVSSACKYLKKSDCSVTEICDLVGFNTLRTFNRAFLKHMGMTPSEYRAKG